MKKQRSGWYKLGQALRWVLESTLAAIVLILILWAMIDQAFKFKRSLVCFRATEMQVGNGVIRITDPRPVYICNY